jgi:uncharacterized protein (TIGR03435 family)
MLKRNLLIPEIAEAVVIRASLYLTAVLLMTIPLSAQQSPIGFGVASIKRDQSGETRIVQGLQPGGRYVATNIPLRMLIMRAYRLMEFQLTGGPGWVNTERYDIVGLAPGATTSDDITPRLQSLLADRFKLTTHMEKREMPVLWLVLANKDGRLGPKLHRSTADCPLVAPPGVPPAAACLMRSTPASLMTGGSRMIAFVNAFSQITQKTVADRTGLTGLFEADLRWTPDAPQVTGVAPGAPETAPAYDPSGPSFTTAIREQLGLRLENRRDSVEVLVIDRIEHPTEN